MTTPLFHNLLQLYNSTLSSGDVIKIFDGRGRNDDILAEFRANDSSKFTLDSHQMNVFNVQQIIISTGSHVYIEAEFTKLSTAILTVSYKIGKL